MDPEKVEGVKQQEKEIVEDLEHQVEDLEHDFEAIKSDNVSEETRDKQETVVKLLKEVHEQLEFLKSVAEQNE